MSTFANESEPLQPPRVIGTMLAPVRPQIVDQGPPSEAAEISTDSLVISDPTKALLQAWKTVADVLGFYQERLINESYIGTAVEDRSVFELARMVGYAPDWGLAANCYVYYTIDESVMRDVRIPARSKIRAIPQPDEEPQTFETSKDLIARSSWNAIRAATTTDFPVSPATLTLYLRGTMTGLKPGDLMLTTQSERDIYFLVSKIDVNREADQTTASVTLRYGQMGAFPVSEKKKETQTEPLSPPPPAIGASSTDAYYQMQMKGQSWIEGNALKALASGFAADAVDEPIKVIGFRRRIMVFGHSAPRRPIDPRRPEQGDKPWAIDDEDKTQLDVIDLEGHQPSVVPSSRLCIEIPGRSVHGEDLEFYSVSAVQLTSRTAYGMTGDITRVKLDRPWKPAVLSEKLDPRQIYEEVVQRAIVHLDDADLHIGKKPIDWIGVKPKFVKMAASPEMEQRARPDNAIELDGIYPGINPGRRVILVGDPPEGNEPAEGQEPELLTVLSVSHPPYPYGDVRKEAAHQGARSKRTTLTFKEKLKYSYAPGSIRIYGNVVEATHGETYREVLGSGAGSREHQSFGLTRSPLTQLPVQTFPGARPELSVTVGDEEWTCVDTLARSSHGERVFSLWIDDMATARVYFGNGVAGARLPTGRENVEATYRIGVGRAGNIAPKRLKLAVDHPLGVQEVSNTRASGGSDREPISLVRSNTPLSTVALDRLVSQGDFLHMARVYPGIVKAKVSYLSVRSRTIVVVSILSDGVVPLEANSTPCKALQAAMTNHQDGATAVFVVPGVLCPISIVARVKTRPGVSWDDTEAMVRAALIDVFGFQRRELAQPAHASAALAAIQSVKTVEFATIDCFQRYDPDPVTRRQRQSCIEASEGVCEDSRLVGAELLLVQPHIPGSITLVPEELS
ncbi:baseplate J/gp47 family protein [Bradyrhizobium sp. JYMT SZCCT0180]|uniref:baseplate J/gp47 family protein n=1 Tax=Bradyrhizobium sp. JYMT SZCCT0180 TaxID=2807666 RepID=UPI001BACC304|nr:baseplate J/gp47 family protein [Bradyrhizobium sp. JYMT SZCCT0180]MBR1214654.1 baseplate J/gp47 family protein [Bradyrhizobium sp. JYMT SZCCT0180]